MKRLLLFAFAGMLVTLAGCSQGQSGHGQSFEENMQNPLFAELYYTQLVDRLAELQIQDDASLKDQRITDRVNAEKLSSLKKAQDLREYLKTGLSADFIPIKEQIQGSVFTKDGMVFFSPDFISNPGIDLHVVLTNAVDPRDVEFPDKDSIDLGRLQSTFGAQQFTIPQNKQKVLFRTVVLYDIITKRIYAFAQLG